MAQFSGLLEAREERELLRGSGNTSKVTISVTKLFSMEASSSRKSSNTSDKRQDKGIGFKDNVETEKAS